MGDVRETILPLLTVFEPDFFLKDHKRKLKTSSMWQHTHLPLNTS